MSNSELILKFSKVRNVKSPERGTELSAGIDFFVPEFTQKFLSDIRNKNEIFYLVENKILLTPHQRILIPSGIHVNIPKGYALIAYNKSGVSSKKGLDVLACVVDEDYQGEVHISLVNSSNERVYIEPCEKIVQFILIPVLYAPLQEVNYSDLYEKASTRGSGGFGSTGK